MPPNCGAIWESNGVRYRVWAPAIRSISVEIETRDRLPRSFPLQAVDGYHEGFDSLGQVGDAYRYLLDGEKLFPDPVSRGQADGVHGPSLVIDPTFAWTDAAWQRPVFRDLVIYELHVGTFTPAGTFRAVIDHLAELRELGVNAIELLPIGDFPGDRNWGYDGVLLYAPARSYGPPEDLRALVDAAHALGIAVVLDVVFNHLGPDGNYLGAYSPDYFTDRHHTPWGKALNFDGKNSGPVREFFLGNIRYWMDDFHFDGFRLDATHEIPDDSTPHLLAEIAAIVHAAGGYVIAEDPRNEARLLEPPDQGGLGLDAVWADDFHHSLRVTQTRENSAYFQDFNGSLDEVVTAIRDGWIYTGQYFSFLQANRGTPGAHLPPERFVHCISNHDQTGNRAFGERLNHLISPAAYRALSALLCLSPYTPMLFMGQEWGAGTPFLFFTDHHDELGRAVTEGRRREFSAFAEFADPRAQARIPDPQARLTFDQSKLRWEESDHSPIRALYQRCLQLRQEFACLRPPSREGWQVRLLDCGVGCIDYENQGRRMVVVFELFSGHSLELANEPHLQLPDGFEWRCRFSSQESRFGGIREILEPRFDFAEPEVLLLESVPN